MKSQRLGFWFIAALSAGLVGDLAGATRPNVLLVITDDQGYGDIASHGNPYLRTPRQDGLAAAGARFDRFFVSPVCAPTRASLLTGRYSLRTGVHGVTRGHETMRSDEYTIAEALRDAGYVTGAFGKWHNGRHMPNHPNGQGFSEFVGFCGGHWNRYFDANLERNGEPIETHGYVADVITEAALAFIERHRQQPWFCYVPLNTPHSPWRVPEEYWQRFEGKGLDERARCAYAMVENIDWNLGRLLDKVQQIGATENTLVLFLTDNGANSDRFNAGMRGRKGSVDEGGVRVPLFVRYPGVIKPGITVDRLAAHIDLFPTVLELCGIDVVSPKPLDGRSLAPLLRQESSDWPERTFFTERFRAGLTADRLRSAVRTSRWRAVHAPRQGWRLYDMQADPGQTKDVSGDHPQVVVELANRFQNWFEGTGAKELGYHPVPVGHPAREQFELPAHEAELEPGHGQGVEYTGSPNGFANNWITAWSDRQATARWILNVIGPGRYRVELQYALAPEHLPTTLALEVAGQHLESQITKAHAPSFRPKADRFLPSDGYREKTDWATHTVGEIDLESGQTELAIKPIELTGGESIELKSIRLTRIR